MNTAQIEANVEALMASWSKDTFIYELLLAYGVAKSTVTSRKVKIYHSTNSQIIGLVSQDMIFL